MRALNRDRDPICSPLYSRDNPCRESTGGISLQLNWRKQMANQTMITDEVIALCYELAKVGAKPRALVNGLPISQSSYYRCKDLWQKHHDLSQEERDELSLADRKGLELWEAYLKGRRELFLSELTFFQKVKDPKLRWQIFKSIFPQYQEKRGIDLDLLESELTVEYGKETARKFVDMLMEED